MASGSLRQHFLALLAVRQSLHHLSRPRLVLQGGSAAAVVAVVVASVGSVVEEPIILHFWHDMAALKGFYKGTIRVPLKGSIRV